jgi:hypothetical protein
MLRFMQFRFALIPLLALALQPSILAAQAGSDRAARADALYEQAVQRELESPTGSFRQHVRDVARLHLRSAALREDSDPLKIESYERAGTLLYAVSPRRAHRAFERAAELALLHGQVARSAQAHLDAAAVVHSKRLVGAAHQQSAAEAVQLARTLADHPVVSAAQRDAILTRLELGIVAGR